MPVAGVQRGIGSIVRIPDAWSDILHFGGPIGLGGNPIEPSRNTGFDGSFTLRQRACSDLGLF